MANYTGTAGADTWTGTDSNDTASGLGGNDTLNGAGGDDILNGGTGADALDGGDGFDYASYANATTAIFASLANPSANTGEAVGDTYANIEGLIGGNFADTLVGDSGDNTLQGGGSSDLLIGGAGADTLNGGSAQTDIASYETATSGVTVDLTNGANNTGDAAGDVYIDIEAFKGSAYADVFVSAATVNSDFRGGAGDDAYYVDSASDLLTEAASQGVDTVYATSASYTLSANIENLIYLGTGNFTGTGNASANTITGGDGDDILIGGAGADALDGGWGNNTASYSTSTTVVVASLANPSANTGDAAGDTYANIQNLTGGTQADTLIGDAGDNILSGGNSSDILIGGAGADTLNGGSAQIDVASYSTASSGVVVDLTNGANNTGDAAGDIYIDIETWLGSSFDDVFVSSSATTTFQGGAGNDTYYVDSTADVITEAAGQGTDTVVTTAAAYAIGANLENLTYQGTANFTGTGNASNNAITGGDGNDTLIGGAGADALDGGAGNNTASYSTSTTNLVVSLANPASNTSDAAGDTYANIQNLTGGTGLDTLIGDGQDNILSGGNSNDVLIGGAGADVLDGGGATDTASYSTAGAGVVVDLTNLANNAGDAAGDSYIGIETFQGSSFGDVFVSSAALNTTFQGGAGDDTYYVDSVSDAVNENASEGNDTVYASGSAFTLGANVETLIYTGSVAFTGTGNATNNTIVGGDGADTLSGLAGADALSGGDGDDTLIGGAGADAMDGGWGNNTASYSTSTTVVVASLANPSSNTGDAAGDSYANIQNLTGGTQADTLIGDAGDNILSGGNSSDILIGGAGADTLNGGSAQIDVASYSTATSGVTVDLTNGANNTGDAAGDTYIDIETWLGSSFDDVFVSSSATTTFQGGAGNDTYYVDSTADVVTEAAGQGTDTVVTTATAYVLGANLENLTYQGTANFTGTGSAVANIIIGGDGNDTLIGGAGADTLDGAGGNNTASYSTSTTNLVASLANPSSNTGDAAGDSYANIQNLTGGTGLDTLIGDAGDNILSGGNSSDVLIGGAGADTLNGGSLQNDVASYSTATSGVTVDLTNGANNTGDAAGDTYIDIETWLGTSFDDVFVSSSALNTTFQGGAGNDTYYVDSASDVATENTGQGTDTVVTTATAYVLGANLENLTYQGTANFTGTGNASANAITGGDGNDILIGGAGADALDGAAGVNTASYSTSTTNLVVSLANPSSNTSDAAGDTYVNIQNLTGGTGLDTLIGDDGNNVLSGGNSNDTLIGGLGADVLDGGGATDTASYSTAGSGVVVDLTNLANNAGDAAGDSYIGIETWQGTSFDDVFVSSTALVTTFQGGAGNDTYYVDSTSDVVTEAAGQGTDTVVTTATAYVLGANLENLTYQGTGNFTGTGSAVANIILGGDGNDTLIGGGGADTLDGGGGNNTASYVNASTSVVASLANPSANTGEAAGDTYANIENLTGGVWTDTLIGDDQANSLYGGNSEDVLIGGAGADILNGGADIGDRIDTASYATAGSAVTVDLTNGANNTGDAAGDTFISIELFQGTSFDDTFVSSSTLNTTFKGGAGDDVYYVDSASDVVTENAAEGNDTVYASSLTYTLGANVETLIYTGSGNFTGTGGSTNNAIFGGNGNDILIGAGGADALDGGAGTNTASYATSTTVVTASLANPSANTGDAAGDTYASIQNLTGGTNADTLIGDDGDNVLSGGNSSDILIGGAGADTLNGGSAQIDVASYSTATSGVTVDLTNGANNTGDAAGDTYIDIETWLGSSFDDIFVSSSALNTTFQGGAGNDAYHIDSASDVVTEAASAGVDTVYTTTASYTLGANVENLVYAGSGAFTGTGNALANAITGGGGVDVLAGAGGADVLTGGGGNDLFDFNALGDSGGSAIDVVLDFTSGDKIDLSTIDADAGLGGNQAFHVDGTIGGSGDIGISYNAGLDVTVIDLYVDNNASIDATIWVSGNQTLTSADFVL